MSLKCPGHPRLRVGGDHLGRLDVPVAQEEVAQEGDGHALLLDVRRRSRFAQRAAGAEVRDAVRVERADRVEQPLGAVVDHVVVREAHHVDAAGHQRRHQLGLRAEVEVLGDLLAAVGEGALEVDHEDVGPGGERAHPGEAPGQHLVARLALLHLLVDVFFVVVARASRRPRRAP